MTKSLESLGKLKVEVLDFAGAMTIESRVRLAVELMTSLEQVTIEQRQFHHGSGGNHSVLRRQEERE